MRKKILNILIIFMFIFLAIFSFSVGRKIKLSIPKCTCFTASSSVIYHADHCKMKQYFKNMGLELSLKQLSQRWDDLKIDEQENVAEIIAKEDPKKYLEFLEKIDNKDVVSVSTTVRDGTKILVEGDFSKDIDVDAYRTNQKKIKIIEDEILKEIRINDYEKIERIFPYDINLKKQNENVHIDKNAVITLSDIDATKEKKYRVYHLLDEEKAVSEANLNNSIKQVVSDKFNDYFTRELEAAKTLNSTDNSVYVDSFEAFVNNDGSISFSSDSFSTFYIVEYTVDFHYNGITFNMEGGTSMLLSDLFKELDIERKVEEVDSVTFSDESLLEIKKQDNGDWTLNSKKPFSTTETLLIYFSDTTIIELMVTDASDPYKQTTNDAVGLGTQDIYTVHQIFGTLYPEIEAMLSSVTLSVKTKENNFILQEANGTQVATAYTGNNNVMYGTNFTLKSDDWWFTASGDIEETDTSISHLKYKYKLSGYDDIIVKRYPRVTYSNSKYCTVKQRSALSLGMQQRKVYVYANGNEVEGSGTSYAFPTRGGVNASYIDVTGVDSNIYSESHTVTSDGANYAVYLNSKVTLKFNANGGIGTLPVNQVLIYGNTFTIPNTSLVKEGYDFLGWAETATATTAQYKTNTSYTSTYTNGGSTKELYAVWKAKQVNYTVEHYLQNESNIGYSDVSSANSNRTYATSNKTENIISATDQKLIYNPLSTLSSAEFVVIPDAKCYIDNVLVDCSTAKLQYGKTATIKLYYKRQTYSVDYNYSNSVTGAPTIPAQKIYFSKADVTVASVTNPTGYTLQWYKDNQIVAAGAIISDVTSNITLTGTWIPKTDAYYNIYYYLEGTTTPIKTTDVITNVGYGTQVNVSPPNIAGYTYTSASSQSITVGYGTSNIILYYKPNTNTPYTVVYVEYNENQIIKQLSVENRTGTTGAIPTYSEKEFEGFTFNDYEIRVIDDSGNITNDSTNIILGTGKTVVLVKYERNEYNIFWSITKEDDNTYKKEGIFVIEYEGDLNSKLNEVIPKIENYEFSGWSETYDKMPSKNINISGMMKRKLKDLIIKKTSVGISVFGIKDLETGKTIEVLVNGTEESRILNLPVGNKYEIVELATSIWNKPSLKQEITIKDTENIVQISTDNLAFSWFRSEIFKRNIFGIIT